MEWNAKSTSQWEWEKLINFSAKPPENSNKLQSEDWTIDEMRGADSGSFYSSGGGHGGSPPSDFGYASSTKSSKSASMGSPSIGEANTFRPAYGAAESIIEGFCNKKEFSKTKKTSTFPTFEASLGSGEPLLSLKLGKGTDCENASGRSSANSSYFSVVPVPTISPAKRSKSSSLSVNPPRCQVEGCNLDLSLAKDYHRKHRVCESHAKFPKVIIGGLERRFCQQCSRFHGLLEFDEKKRSCRKRLSDHNARRRKPQPEPVKLNSANLYSSFSDGTRHLSFGWNKGTSFPAKPSTNIMWGTTCNPVFMQTKEYMEKAVKMGSNNGLLNQSSNGRSNITATMRHDSSGFHPSKGTLAVAPNQDLFPVSSHMGSAQEFHRALSLLSTSSGGSCEPKHASLDQAMNATPPSMHQTMVHTLSPSSPIPLSDFWQCGRPESEVPAFTSQNLCNIHYQGSQQLRAPYEGAFYSAQFD